jgi:hypothetical protein
MDMLKSSRVVNVHLKPNFLSGTTNARLDSLAWWSGEDRATLNEKAREVKETAFGTTTPHNAIEISVFKSSQLKCEVDQDGLRGCVPDPTGAFIVFPFPRASLYGAASSHQECFSRL